MKKRARIPAEVWEQARAEYMAGRAPRAIAAKHGIDPQTLNKKIVREKWKDERSRRARMVAEIEREKVVELSAEFYTSEKIRFIREQVNHADLLIQRGLQFMGEIDSARDYYDIARGLKLAHEMKARALETTGDKREREIDEAMQELVKIVSGTVTYLPAS